MAADNADVLAADNADVLAADTTDVLAADITPCSCWRTNLTGFGVKIDLKVTKTIKTDTCLPEVVVFPGKNRRRPPRAGTPHVFAVAKARPSQGKAKPGQAKPRQGKPSKPSPWLPKFGGCLANIG